MPTSVYCASFILLFVINSVLAYQQAAARFPGNIASAIGYVQGSLLVPLAAAAGIACIWNQNRGFRGVVRVLFWASLFLLFTKVSQPARNARPRPNKPAATNAGLAPRLTIGNHWREISKPVR